MDWSRISDMWQVLGGIGTVISLLLALIMAIATVYFYRKAKKTAALSCAFSTPYPLATVSPMVTDDLGIVPQERIRILYNDEDVSNVFVIQARLRNTGNTVLTSEAVHSDVTFTFGPSTRLLSASPYRAEPANIKHSLDLSDERSAILKFELLNPGDKLYLGFVYDGGRATPAVTARIENVQPIKEETWDQSGTAMWSWVLMGLGGGMMGMGLNSLMDTLAGKPLDGEGKLGVGLTLIGFILAVVTGWRSQRRSGSHNQK